MVLNDIRVTDIYLNGKLLLEQRALLWCLLVNLSHVKILLKYIPTLQNTISYSLELHIFKLISLT